MTPLLWACPPEDEQATVAWSNGRPVFDGGRDYCIRSMEVTVGDDNVIWRAAQPPAEQPPGPCGLRFPVAYGTVPSGWTATPSPPPPLHQGIRYRFRASGGASNSYVAEFTVP